MRPAVVFGSIAFSAVLLAACKGGGGGGGSPVPTTSPSSGPGGRVAYVANYSLNTVSGYSPLQTNPALTISTGVNSPVALAVDASGNLFVDNCQPCVPNAGSSSSIAEYARGVTSPGRTIVTGLNEPFAIALDGSGNLYVANFGSSTVTIYAPRTTAPSRTISSGVAKPIAIAVDGQGNVYVANDPTPQATNVTVFSSTGSLLRTLNVPGIQSIALDSAANVYASSCILTCNSGTSPDSVTIFNANSTTVKYTIATGLSYPTFMAFDGANNLYVANDSRGTANDVVVFKANSTALIATIQAPGPAGIAIDNQGIAYIPDGFNSAGVAYNTMTEYHGGATLTVSSGIGGAVAIATSTTPAPSTSP